MELFFNISRYFRYLFTAKTPHGVHSPFVFDFINNLLRDKTPFYAFGTLRKAREAFLSDNRTVTVTDFGSGGKSGLDKQLRIRHLAIRQALPAKYANLLFRMVNHFQPEKVLELGTSLGLTTLHLAAANTKAKIITIEGSPGTSAIASELFEKYKAKSIEIRTGEFSDMLPGALESLERLDFLFADGNHRYLPTKKYFETVLPYCHAGSILVFDDIHWSNEMERAWEEIRRHEKVTLSIDMFRLGILFFHDGRKAEHFTLRY